MKLKNYVRPEKISGYEMLNDKNKGIFEEFLSNFKNAWGFEARSNIELFQLNM